MRIERAYSKDRILELYLNQIYLGLGAYGIAAASLLYFDKSVHELTIAEAAYLAALPKGPNNYNPFRHKDEAIGLLLCESHDGAVVEFSFKDIQKPIGVSTYTVTRELPKALEQEVPSIQDLKGVVESFEPSLKPFARRSLPTRRKGSDLDGATPPRPGRLPPGAVALPLNRGISEQGVFRRLNRARRWPHCA